MLPLLLLFSPLVGMVLCLILQARLAKWVALVTSIFGVVLGVLLYFGFQAQTAQQMQFFWSAPWLTSYNIQFSFGVDGLSLPMILLTQLMMPTAVLASWAEDRRPKFLMSCFLVLHFAMVGTFLTTDIFLFYIFWEVMLIPMILLIGIWGSQNRLYAAMKFFLFTFAGSVLMLASIFYVFWLYSVQTGTYTGQMGPLTTVLIGSEPVLWKLSVQDLVFIGFALAFLIKVPLFPFHTWLPDAHVQAPTGASVLLAAVLLKMGTYGLLRLAIPTAPQSFLHFGPCLAVLSLIGIIYGAWAAYQQPDMKKLVAYSSVSHLGYVVLGICALNPTALSGAMLQMVNHGLTSGALFLLVGMLYERRHTRMFADYGGLAEVLPWFSIVLVYVACSSMAVPGLNSFVGEFLILLGTFHFNPWWALVACLGVIFGAVYMLSMVKKILFGGNISAENKGLKDMNAREWAAFLPLGVFILVLGVAPGILIQKIEPSLVEYWKSPRLQPEPKTALSYKTDENAKVRIP